MTLSKLAQSARLAVAHPAALFSAGNTALAAGHAEPIGVILNIGLTVTIFSTRFIEVLTSRTLGIPFSILAGVNFFTALSVEFNKALGADGSRLFAEGLKSFDFSVVSTALSMIDLQNLTNLNTAVIAGHISAFALVVWGVGHIYAGRHDKQDTTANRIKENPQTYYGAGDIAAVNASGSLNPLSFPFMLLGFAKSVVIGRQTTRPKHAFGSFLQKELTAARLYGIGYIVGALTSLSIGHFAAAQLLWALAYFSFKKDT